MIRLITRRRSWPVLGLAILLVAAACSSAGEEVAERIAEQAEGVEDVEISQSDDELTVEMRTEEGEASLSVGTGDLPDDFPFPIPDGFSVTASFTAESATGPAYTAVLVGPSGVVDEVAGIYEAFLNGEGFEITRMDSSGGGTSGVILGGVRDELGVSVVVSDSGAQTDLSLSWGS